MKEIEQFSPNEAWVKAYAEGFKAGLLVRPANFHKWPVELRQAWKTGLKAGIKPSNAFIYQRNENSS